MGQNLSDTPEKSGIRLRTAKVGLGDGYDFETQEARRKELFEEPGNSLRK